MNVRTVPSDSFVVPPPVERGDRVAVVSPAAGLASEFPEVFELGLSRLRDVFDLEPVVFPSARQSSTFLEERPRARAADIHAAFQDPSISGVISTIGGYDQLRVLRYLDPETLRTNPTRFYGMSDNTNIGLFLWKAGIVSYNGGQLMNELGVRGELPAYTERSVSAALFDVSLGELAPSDVWTDEPTDWWGDDQSPTTPPSYRPNPGGAWAGGTHRVSGPVWGGCRAVVDQHLACEQYLPEPSRLEGAILALEIAADLPSPEQVATSMLCLGERGLLDQFSAVVVGRIPGRNRTRQPSRETQKHYREAVRSAIRQQVARYNPDAPLVFGLDWGHTTPIVPLPLGSEMEVDPRRKRIAVV